MLLRPVSIVSIRRLKVSSSKHLKFFSVNLLSIQNLIQQRGNFTEAIANFL